MPGSDLLKGKRVTQDAPRAAWYGILPINQFIGDCSGERQRPSVCLIPLILSLITSVNLYMYQRKTSRSRIRIINNYFFNSFRQRSQLPLCFDLTTQHISTVYCTWGYITQTYSTHTHTYAHTKNTHMQSKWGGGGRDAETTSRQPAASQRLKQLS